MKPVSNGRRETPETAEPSQKCHVAARPDHDGLVERRRQPVERFAAVAAMRDDFGDHRIVIRRHLAPASTPVSTRMPSPSGNSSAASLPVDGRKPRSGSSA